ncbi:MAG: hypothetical protein K0Q46_4541 [Rhodococcus erythropolis]|nr:hypothetical protein [Rhodococcus erythropolis]
MGMATRSLQCQIDEYPDFSDPGSISRRNHRTVPTPRVRRDGSFRDQPGPKPRLPFSDGSENVDPYAMSAIGITRTGPCDQVPTHNRSSDLRFDGDYPSPVSLEHPRQLHDTLIRGGRPEIGTPPIAIEQHRIRTRVVLPIGVDPICRQSAFVQQFHSCLDIGAEARRRRNPRLTARNRILDIVTHTRNIDYPVHDQFLRNDDPQFHRLASLPNLYHHSQSQRRARNRWSDAT